LTRTPVDGIASGLADGNRGRDERVSARDGHLGVGVRFDRFAMDMSM
jgi:hypothetical protein